jgi:hypothetical protein
VHDSEIRHFVERFAGSLALAEGEDNLAEYLWDYGAAEPAWALEIVDAVLENPCRSAGSLRGSGGENFVRLVLRIYNGPTTNDALRESAMDVFDRLSDEYAHETQGVLDEWDQGRCPPRPHRAW